MILFGPILVNLPAPCFAYGCSDPALQELYVVSELMETDLASTLRPGFICSQLQLWDLVTRKQPRWQWPLVFLWHIYIILYIYILQWLLCGFSDVFFIFHTRTGAILKVLILVRARVPAAKKTGFFFEKIEVIANAHRRPLPAKSLVQIMVSPEMIWNDWICKENHAQRTLW